MRVIINELSFIGQAKDNYEADELMKVLVDVVKELEPILVGGDQIQVHSCFASRQISLDCSVSQWFSQNFRSYENSKSENDKTVARLLVRILRKGPFIDRTLAQSLDSWECHFNQQDVSGSSLAGAAYFKAALISLPNAPEFAVEHILVRFSTDGKVCEDRNILNLTAVSQASKLRPRYVPSPKHAPGGWGTLMDLSDEDAQKVLDKAIPSGRQYYGYHQGKFYEFQSDNADGFHGYPVDRSEVPPPVLRKMKV